MHDLSIDIETYCDVDIAETGLYRYVQDDSFEILLFAYSLDDSPVEIIDLAQGERMPAWILSALQSDEYVKHAYNAAFEWYCLSKYYGLTNSMTERRRALFPVSQWRDTMLQSLYHGYPASLESVGNALNLGADKKKLTTGKALIRYFCKPCKPTETNGERVRNFPEHAPDKWELFKTYCKGDVVTEKEVYKKLSVIPVPEEIEKQWQTDLIINSRGVAVDMDLVEGAIELDEFVHSKLLEKVKSITRLENPNSVSQLKSWLEKETDLSVPSIAKDAVAALLTDAESLVGDKAQIKEVLECRKELSKTSIKKYNAVKLAVCKDRKVRGLLQFYGASRSGRWAGRLIQVQNLPRTYIPNEYLSIARQMVQNRQCELLELVCGSVLDALSQLIRTVFTASTGHILVDADFSSIEARVIAWLAGEKWRLQVFKTHGKIYEASASQMFNVPIERIVKGNPEYSLRQKGKIAELALGYQGAKGALINMGALEMGIPEDDLDDIVNRWRASNQAIVKLWYAVEQAAKQTIITGQTQQVNRILFKRRYLPEAGLDFFTITLPSNRELFYASPIIAKNRYGRDAIVYKGVNQTTRQWTDIETYGGKLVENIVQAIARDCLAVAIERLEKAGYPIVFHIHDEVVIDVPLERANLKDVVKHMTMSINWAPELPLAADGWIGDFFKKE